MSKGAKIAIIVVVGLIVLMGTCAGAGAWWWNKNGDQLIANAREGMAEGAAWGEKADSQQACLEEGLERSAACEQMQLLCGTKAQIFTQGCLYAAPKAEQICDGVPAAGEVMDTVSWSRDACKARGQSLNNFCPNILSSLQAYCERPDTPPNLEGPRPEPPPAPEPN